MPSNVVMPRLSDTMTEGTLARWLKQPGDVIHKGDTIAEVETDKATMAVEAFDEGTLGEILVREGESAPVGQPIARLNGHREEEQKEEPEKAEATPAKEEKEEERKEEEGAHRLERRAEWGGQDSRPEHPPVQPPSKRREQRLAAERKMPSEQAGPTPAPQKTRRPEAGTGRVSASPRARKIAAEEGIDLTRLTGSGPGGRIVEADVRASLAEARPEGGSANAGYPEKAEEPSRMRRTIAQRMTESKQQIPHFYTTAVVRADSLVRLRENLKRQLEVSYNDLLIKACALALRRHSRLNASYREGRLHWHPEINIGMAVAVPDGLLVPVIAGADQLSLGEVAQKSREIAARARSNTLHAEDMTGGTFTISNMGASGVESFSAIINPPQAGILAVGAIREVPVVENGTVIPGRELRLILSADHRVVNGIEAAAFLSTIKHLLENPVLLEAAESSFVPEFSQ